MFLCFIFAVCQKIFGDVEITSYLLIYLFVYVLKWYLLGTLNVSWTSDWHGLFWTNSKVLLKSTEGLFQPALIHLKWIFSITLHKKIMLNFTFLHSWSPKTVKTKEHLHVLLKITSPWTEATCSALCGSPGRRQTVKWKWLLTFEHQQSHWEPFSCSPRLLWIYLKQSKRSHLQHSKRFQRSHPPSAPGGQVWAVLTGGLRERGLFVCLEQTNVLYVYSVSLSSGKRSGSALRGLDVTVMNLLFFITIQGWQIQLMSLYSVFCPFWLYASSSSRVKLN